MVGLGQVDEFEVEAEGSRELIGSGKIEGVYSVERLLETSGGGSGIGCARLGSFGLTTGRWRCGAELPTAS